MGRVATILLTLVVGAARAALQPPTLSSVAHNVGRVESVREIKDVQRTFGHLAQYGRWSDMAALFADDGTMVVQMGMSSSSTSTAKGPAAIEAWLQADAGDMNGVQPRSLHALVIESPVVTLSEDGLTAKARWNALQLMGDGSGGTRIQGGIYENEYALAGGGRWKISLLHYYVMYAGPYSAGWHNVGTGSRTLPIIPYHFTADSAGIPILNSGAGVAAPDNVTNVAVEDIARRIARLNDEDEVRNLQHSYGYYVDRRLWTDAADLFAADATVNFSGAAYSGSHGIRQFLERMGSEGLTEGILNDHPMFETIVDVSGSEAVARGLEIGMIGDATSHTASWEFNIFRNHFVKSKDDDLWRFKELSITPLLVANYSGGWGTGILSSKTSAEPPAFVNIARRAKSNTSGPANSSTEDVADLQRRLARSAAFDSSENESGAYGYYADDIRCDPLGAIHAKTGNKESPGFGWFRGADAIAKACHARYNATDPAPKRGSVPFHWRPQPVIHVSQDGRSTSLRARLLQFGTSNSNATGGGFSGVAGFNGGMYHDQTVLEDGTSRWRLWSTTIDEFYWRSPSWAGGWASATRRAGTGPGAGADTGNSSRGGLAPGGRLREMPADLSLKDTRLGEREVGLEGGAGKAVTWPEIQHMWFAYRNPVSGRLPQYYWPGCVPCQAEPDWALLKNGYQEPPTGPTALTATVGAANDKLTVTVAGGPDEPVLGTVEVRDGELLVGSAVLAAGNATIKLLAGLGSGSLTVTYLGSDRLNQARTAVSYSAIAPMSSP